MASGVALRESVKEMKRLKNEPLLMLAIIAIILFVGFFVVYPVIRVITFPSGQDYMRLPGPGLKPKREPPGGRGRIFFLTSESARRIIIL